LFDNVEVVLLASWIFRRALSCHARLHEKNSFTIEPRFVIKLIVASAAFRNSQLQKYARNAVQMDAVNSDVVSGARKTESEKSLVQHPL
jgi:hypothetical protein